MFLRLPQIPSLTWVYCLISLLLLNFLPQSGIAEEISTAEWNISADNVMRYEQPNSIIAKGNVILEKKELVPPKPPKAQSSVSSWTELLEENVKEPEILAEEVSQDSKPQYKTTVTIRADWIVYDVELQSIKAKGNVQIDTSDDHLTAKEGTLNLINETGKFTDATILRKEQSLHLEGKTIEKTGFDTYTIVDGWVITCKLENGQTPPWSFSSSKTDITQGGYAVLKNAMFNIKNVPVLYSPYLIVPVKNTRQTGFLFPEFSQSTNSGFGFNLPFFLNISDSIDTTFYPEYYQKRGFMPGAEFRYVASNSNKGTFTGSYLDDQLSDPSEVEYYNDTGYTHDNSDRYWMRGKADHTFGENWQTRLDVDIVSDQDYLTEFDSGVTGFKSSHDRYLEEFGRGFQNQTDALRKNELKVLRSWSGISLEGSLLAINDANTNASDTDTPLWKLPSIAFSGALPVGETGLTFDWNTDYVDYWREDGIGGHRFDIHPSLAAPIPLGPYLESRAEVSLRDTFYKVQKYGDAQWDKDDTQNRLIPEFKTEIATTLEKNFFNSDNGSRTAAHQLRPYVKYGYIPDVDQKDLPSFDKVDFVGEKNAISYGIDNFINVFSPGKNNQEKSREYGNLKISQSYDLRDTTSDEPFSDILAKLSWTPIQKARVNYKTYFDVYDSTFNRHTFESEFTDSRGDYFSLDYSFKEKEDIEQLNATIRAKIINGWFLGAEVEHSLSQSETVKANGSLTYQALCWSLKFETRYTPGDTTYLLVFNLANIGIPLGVSF